MSQSTAIGFVALLSFFSACIGGLYCQKRAQNKYTRRIFLCLSIFCILELPLYFRLCIYGEINKVVYVTHMLAGIFYFACFGFVCFAWEEVLNLNGMQRPVLGAQRYRVKALLIALNFLFGIATIWFSYKCSSADSLSSFTDSRGFLLFNLLDGIKNLFIAVLIAFYGGTLHKRLTRFGGDFFTSSRSMSRSRSSSLDQLTQAIKSPFFKSPEFSNPSSQLLNRHQSNALENSRKISKAVFKLDILIIVSVVCFLARVIVVSFFIVHQRQHSVVADDSFSNNRFIVWFGKDFLPAILPGLAFFYCMGYKKNSVTSPFATKREVIGSLLHRERQGSNENDSVDSHENRTSFDRSHSLDRSKSTERNQNKIVVASSSGVVGRISGELVDVDINRRSITEPLVAYSPSNSMLTGSSAGSDNSSAFVNIKRLLFPAKAEDKNIIANV